MSSPSELPQSAAPPNISPLSRKLVFVLPVAALVLVGLTVWKLTRPPQVPSSDTSGATLVRFAPPLELRDRNQSLVRLLTYLGREKVLVVFFRATDRFTDSPVLIELSRNFNAVHSRGPKIIAIGTQQSGIYRQWIRSSAAAPQDGPSSAASKAIAEHIEQGEILLLSDFVEPHVYKQWGAVNPRTGELAEAVFVVDRAGWIRKSYIEQLTPGGDKDSAGTLGTAEQWGRDLGATR